MLFEAAQQLAILLHEKIGEDARVSIDFNGPNGEASIEVNVDVEHIEMDALDVDGIVRQHPMFADDGPLSCTDTGSAIKDKKAISRDLRYVLDRAVKKAS